MTVAWALVDGEGRIVPLQTADGPLPLVYSIFPTEGVALSFATRKDIKPRRISIEVLQ